MNNKPEQPQNTDRNLSQEPAPEGPFWHNPQKRAIIGLVFNFAIKIVIVIVLWCVWSPEPPLYQNYSLYFVNQLQFISLAIFVMLGLGLASISSGVAMNSLVNIFLLAAISFEFYFLLANPLAKAFNNPMTGATLGGAIGSLGLCCMLFISCFSLVNRISPTQLSIYMSVAAIGYCVLQAIVNSFGIKDTAGLAKVHIYAGLLSIFVNSIFKQRIKLATKYEAEEAVSPAIKNVASVLGNSFLWIYLPVVISLSEATPLMQSRAALGLVLGAVGTVLGSFGACLFVQDSLDPAPILVASLNGILLVGSSAAYLPIPGIATLLGFLAGFGSSFLYCNEKYAKFCQGEYSQYQDSHINKFYDPSMALLTHFIPGVMGTFLSMIMQSTAKAWNFQVSQEAGDVFPLLNLASLAIAIGMALAIGFLILLLKFIISKTLLKLDPFQLKQYKTCLRVARQQQAEIEQQHQNQPSGQFEQEQSLRISIKKPQEQKIKRPEFNMSLHSFRQHDRRFDQIQNPQYREKCPQEEGSENFSQQEDHKSNRFRDQKYHQASSQILEEQHSRNNSFRGRRVQKYPRASSQIQQEQHSRSRSFQGKRDKQYYQASSQVQEEQQHSRNLSDEKSIDRNEF